MYYVILLTDPLDYKAFFKCRDDGLKNRQFTIHKTYLGLVSKFKVGCKMPWDKNSLHKKICDTAEEIR